MATYFNLGIDCGTNADMAAAAMAHFHEFVVELPDGAPAICATHRSHQRDLWFVEVWPQGMGYGIPPTLPSRPELCDAQPLEIIRDALHARLQALSGYRRALFGGEAYDLLAFATPEEDNDLDYAGLIFSQDLFPDLPTHCTIKPFASGYLQVTEVRR